MDEMGTEEMWVIVRRGSWHSLPLSALVGVAALARSGMVSIGSIRERERERETYWASERESNLAKM